MSWYKKMALSKNICFFVDLDETLVSSENFSTIVMSNSYGKKYSDLLIEQKKNILDDQGYKIVCDEETNNPLVSKLRPFAKEFLSFLSNLGKVYLCTSAQQDYADGVLKAFGLDSYFTEKYYRHNINGFSIKPCDNFFLIDDLDFVDLNKKFQFLGAPRNVARFEDDEEYEQKKEMIRQNYSPRHIQVRPYLGSDNDNELSNIMGKINELVQKI